MWYVISADGESIVSIHATHDAAFGQAQHLADLRARLMGGKPKRYKVRRAY